MTKPQLCKLLTKAFNKPGWKWERKYDGARMLALTMGTDYTLTARSGTDKTLHFPELNFIGVKDLLLDGEVISAAGLSFQEGIQPRINRVEDQVDMSVCLPACYMVFDILQVEDTLLFDWPLRKRRALLEEVLRPTENVLLVPQYNDGVALYERAKAEGWEGVVGKDMEAPYAQGKRNWIKVKCWHEDVYWVVGFTAGTGKREPYFGALKLATYDKDSCEFTSVGEVGTGFTDEILEQLTKELNARHYTAGHSIVMAGCGGENDILRVNIKYLEVTNAGQLRFPVYLGKAQ